MGADGAAEGELSWGRQIAGTVRFTRPQLFASPQVAASSESESQNVHPEAYEGVKMNWLRAPTYRATLAAEFWAGVRIM